MKTEMTWEDFLMLKGGLIYYRTHLRTQLQEFDNKGYIKMRKYTEQKLRWIDHAFNTMTDIFINQKDVT